MEELEYNQFYISGFQIRRVWSQGEWWYITTDVITYLIRPSNPTMYLQLLIKRKNLKEKIEPNIKSFLFQTKKGKYIYKCSNLCGLWYITHTIPEKYRWRVRAFRSWIE